MLDLTPAPTDVIVRIWRERWGVPLLGVGARYEPTDVKSLLARDPEGNWLGMITWAHHGDEAEVVTLDARVEGKGVGAQLLSAGEAAMRKGGATHVYLAITNDNLRALGFFLHRGYRLATVHLDAMDEVRKVKPFIPKVGRGGIPLTDLWELQKPLGR